MTILERRPVMARQFQRGDRVRHEAHGRGEVRHVRERDGEHHVTVGFEDGTEHEVPATELDRVGDPGAAPEGTPGP
jgi:hypothetical protein